MKRVFVIGGSVPGLALSARLARDGVPVTLVSPAPVHEPRLVAGCSLRRSTLAILARAMGADLGPELGSEQSAFAALEMQEATRGGLRGRKLHYRSDRPIGLSSRHGHILDVLWKRLPALEHVNASVSAATNEQLTLHDGRTLDVGDALVVNAAPKPLLGSPTAPRHVVTAVQAPMRFKPGRERTDVAYAPWLTGERPHLAFYTPFFDPAWPEATFYGINTSVERAEGHDRNASLADVRQRLFEMGDALGLEAVGGDAARGEAMVPVTRAFGGESAFLEATPELGSGAPAILLDGMLAGARGAEVIAENVTKPLPEIRRAVHRALAPIRSRNTMAQRQYYFAPAWVRSVLQAISPKWLMRYSTEDMASLGDARA